jgi:hypothetical protein
MDALNLHRDFSDGLALAGVDVGLDDQALRPATPIHTLPRPLGSDLYILH